MDIKIIVAAHKQCQMPSGDIYLPVQAGAASAPSLGIAGDNQGENISAKHHMFAELTCLYWAWKNLSADYIGLVHYRRYFAGNGIDGFPHLADRTDLENTLSRVPIIVPTKRRYYVETIYSQFAHAHDIRNFDMAGEIIHAKYPRYFPAFENTKQRRSGHICNMCIMRSDYLDEYCQWLFEILFELENMLHEKQAPRSLGFVGERLLDIWLEANRVEYTEQKVWSVGVENNLIKGIKMLGRKFMHQKKE